MNKKYQGFIMKNLGVSAARIDARSKVTGEALYPGDINFPDQAYMKILFARYPHAVIHNINIEKAEKVEGLLAILTAKDVPNNEYGLIMPDQPVLCGPGSNKPYADRVRFIGDQVAVVIADTEDAALEARDLIDVEYEQLPVITDTEISRKDNAPRLHPDRESNVFCHYKIRKGDTSEAFKKADLIVEGEYRTPAQEHAYLQPEAGLAYIDDEGRVTVLTAGQWTHEDQEEIAHALSLNVDKVRVKYAAIGGAFGGREDMSVQIVLALGAWHLHQKGISRPVKIIWNREESIIGHHKRHPYSIYTRWGVNKDGSILAAEVELIADGGAYAYTSTKVLGNATLMCTGPYEIPNVRVDAYAIYTNNIPGGAFRGFGGPQAAFAAETQINRIAEQLRIDPVELRLKNVLREGSLLSVNTPLPEGVNLDQVIAECARNSGWSLESGEWKRQKSSVNDLEIKPGTKIKRGTGFAAAFKNVGFSYGFPEQCWASVELQGGAEIEKVIVYHAGADVGQGAHTVFQQMVSESAGVSLDKVEVIASDTASSKNSGSVSASRLTFMAGNSIIGAVNKAMENWRQEDRPAVGTFQYRPPATTPLDPVTGESTPNFAYGYVAQSVTLEVDTETGQIKILDVVSANDVGKALNPQQVEGQIEGAVIQAAGYALMENFIQKDGIVQTEHLSTYLIPTVSDIPEKTRSLILEYPDPLGPWGARGMAEMPFLPLVPAVIAAVFDATGVWFYDFPLTPQRVLEGLGKI
jgi:CO/xanthine dehydrogenase Mo-binding subunit